MGFECRGVSDDRPERRGSPASQQFRARLGLRRPDEGGASWNRLPPSLYACHRLRDPLNLCHSPM
jgi:hypothetical protein